MTHLGRLVLIPALAAAGLVLTQAPSLAAHRGGSHGGGSHQAGRGHGRPDVLAIISSVIRVIETGGRGGHRGGGRHR